VDSVAADTSSKAQVCFTEAAKKLEPYMRDLPEDICSDFETLKEMSLLQASKIYHLMYGWQSNSTGVRSTSHWLLLLGGDFDEITRIDEIDA